MKGYKAICLYDSEQKRNITFNVKLDDFENDDDINSHIKNIRTLQKDKNKDYNENKKKLSKMQPYENVSIQALIKPIENIFSGAIIQKDINLKLDAKTGNSTIVLGSSKRGKSSVCAYLYKKYYYGDENLISTLFSINAHIPIYNIDPKLLKSICFNNKSENYIKLQHYINTKTKPKSKYKFLNILDDIIDNKHSKLMNQLILTYRNANINTIISTQYVFLLSKMIRSNLNNLLIFGANTNEAIQDIIQIFLKPYFQKLGYKDYNSQISFFKYITNNHGFFYIHPESDTLTFHRLNL